MSIRFESRFHFEKDTFLDFAKIQRDKHLVLQLDYSRQSKIGKQSANDNSDDSGNVRPEATRVFAVFAIAVFLQRLFSRNLSKQDILKYSETYDNLRRAICSRPWIS